MALDEETLDSELGEEERECEECGAEGATYESWADGGGHVVFLSEDCAHPKCVVCSERIAERPVWGWSMEFGDMVALCEKCAEEHGDRFEV